MQDERSAPAGTDREDKQREAATPLSARILEIDLIRGLCLLGMILHHFAFDVRYVFRRDVFAFQEGDAFLLFLRPLFLIGFILVSGLSSAFSRNQFKRAARIAAAAVVLQIGMAVFSSVQNVNNYVIFNVLHVLAVSQFVYGAAEKLFKNRERRSFLFALGVIGVLSIYIGYPLQQLSGDIANPARGYLRLILGAPYDHAIGMGDFLPLFPWMGIFFIGALLSHVVYIDRETMLSDKAEQNVRRYLRPITWMGQNPLWVYLLHQPVILGILSLVLGTP